MRDLATKARNSCEIFGNGHYIPCHESKLTRHDASTETPLDTNDQIVMESFLAGDVIIMNGDGVGGDKYYIDAKVNFRPLGEIRCDRISELRKPKFKISLPSSTSGLFLRSSILAKIVRS